MSTDELHTLIDLEQTQSVISPINVVKQNINWSDVTAGFAINNLHSAHFETMFNSELIQHMVRISKTGVDLHLQPDLIPMALQSFNIDSIVKIADLIRSVVETHQKIADLPLNFKKDEPAEQATESQGNSKEQSDSEFRQSHKRPRRESITKSIESNSKLNKHKRGSKSKNFHLPSMATIALRDWFVAHWEHPFANNAEKVELQQQTGLSFQQVSNWLTNARKRTWRKKTKSQFKNTVDDDSFDESS